VGFSPWCGAVGAEKGVSMPDLAMLALGIAAFAAAMGYVLLCERL
jgi:hypothetical protein